MKNYSPILLVFLLFSCNSSNSDKKQNELQPDTITSALIDDSLFIEDDSLLNSEMATYYVVIIDTSTEYFQLHEKMFSIHKDLNIPIDTMGRYFNQTKNLIALPDDDEDEIYAGDYFPRRFPSENLSLEYLGLYADQAGEKTMALVSGIYEKEKSADSALRMIKKVEKNTFKLKSEMYIGCLH